MVAALYVEADGVYTSLDGVDAWPESRDARLYAGPWPVVAHPPCQRWGRYWSGGPSACIRRKKGDDGGCFLAALTAVRTWGGILEHPEGSHAWRAFNIAAPPRTGGWVSGGMFVGGWTACVEQGHYGHRARKATWLYCYGVDPPELKWGPSQGERLEDGFHSSAERHEARARGIAPCERLSAVERLRTPEPFRDLLIQIAVSARTARGRTG